jgi:hypothetical protein
LSAPQGSPPVDVLKHINIDDSFEAKRLQHLYPGVVNAAPTTAYGNRDERDIEHDHFQQLVIIKDVSMASGPDATWAQLRDEDVAELDGRSDLGKSKFGTERSMTISSYNYQAPLSNEHPHKGLRDKMREAITRKPGQGAPQQ